MQNFLVYKSSAGSGKTFVLVKEYLKIVLQNPQKVRNILAITFTNAASAEMKGRIIDALDCLASLTPKSPDQWGKTAILLLDTIKNETSLTANDIIRNARLALMWLIHNYGDFNVSTIDSFVHRVIRSFAFDLRIPHNFDVEIDRDNLLKQAVDLLISRAGSEAGLTKVLVQFIESQAEQEKSYQIEYSLIKMANTLLDEKGTSYVDRLRNISLNEFTTIHKKLTHQIREFETEVSEIALKATNLIRNAGIGLNDFYQKDKGIGAWFKTLSQGRFDTKIFSKSIVVKTVEEDRWTAEKASPHIKSAIREIKVELTGYFNQITNLCSARLSNYKIHSLVRKNLFPVALLNEIEKIMVELKTEKSFLHISDFNRKISEIVAAETAPFIYERIGERYHHFMIDEFQDTSCLQWHNLLPLLDNSLAGGHKSLVVGDGKQAIYRWRNGDVEQFANLPFLSPTIQTKHHLQWQETLNRSYHEYRLGLNFRSHHQVVEFNNSFFDFAKNQLPAELQHIYYEHRQKPLDDKTGGYVQLEFIQNIDGLDYTAHTKLRTLAIIKDIIQTGHTLDDITILCRDNSQATEITGYLIENSINVISSESLLLIKSARVNFITYVVRMVYNPDDRSALAGFLHFLTACGTASMTFHEAMNCFRPITQTNESDSITYDDLDGFLKHVNISFSFNKARFLSLYDLCETTTMHFFDPEAPDPFVAFYMDIVYEYTVKNVSSLHDFIDWWHENSNNFSIVVPDGVDAVKVMTIHKSKGLQFQFVIYPFVDSDFSRLSKSGEWIELKNLPGSDLLPCSWVGISSALENTPYEETWKREIAMTLLDNINITYVAFTRAIQGLFILSRYPDSGNFSMKNLAGLLNNYLVQYGLWESDKKIYTFGNFSTSGTITNIQTIRETESGLSSTNKTFDYYPSFPWQNKMTIIKRIHTQWQDDTISAGIHRGSIIHKVLEQINICQDIEPVISRMVFSGSIASSDKDNLCAKITKLLNLPEIRQCYQPGLNARNEYGMFDAEGKYLRADRVVLHNNSATIIDYKTGEKYDGHFDQINEYASVIMQMGVIVINKYLVYIDKGMVESVE